MTHHCHPDYLFCARNWSLSNINSYFAFVSFKCFSVWWILTNSELPWLCEYVFISFFKCFLCFCSFCTCTTNKLILSKLAFTTSSLCMHLKCTNCSRARGGRCTVSLLRPATLVGSIDSSLFCNRLRCGSNLRFKFNSSSVRYVWHYLKQQSLFLNW